MKKSSYEVGYGKPPKHTQFKKGQCANPKGRGARKPFVEKDAFRELLNEKITYNSQGKTKKATRLELLIRRHVAQALREGGVQSAILLLKLHKQFRGPSDAKTHIVTFSPGLPPRPGEEWVEVKDGS